MTITITFADPAVATRLHRVRYSGPISGPRDPRHGTDTGYAAGCRKTCCLKAHSRRRNTDRLYPGTWSLIPATGTHRRIRALARLGWSYAEQSRRLGRHRDYVSKVLRNDELQVETVALFKALYDALSMTWSTAPTAARTAGWATRQGFLPPLAWEGVDLDDPAAVPDPGNPGELPPTGRWKHEVLEDFDWLTSQGVGKEVAAKRVGVHMATIRDYRRALEQEAS